MSVFFAGTQLIQSLKAVHLTISVIHECNAELRKGILAEAHRLLKDDGRLIILEWDKQRKLSRKIKFSPLYTCEVLVNPKYFKEFYYSDKNDYFKKYGFETEENHECNYTAVMSMKKKTD